MFNSGNDLNGRNGGRAWWRTWRNRRGRQDADSSSYRRLAVQLNHSLPRDGKLSRSVLVVTPNEPLHWVNGCVNLASCLAEELARPVLLVEMGESGTPPIMPNPSHSGLAELLQNPGESLEHLAMPTSQPNLWYLSAGTSGGQPPAISADTARSLLTSAARHWDFVVLGGGPLLTNSSALAMAPYAGRVLLLVMENRTNLEDLDAVRSTLQQCGAENVSLVLAEPDSVFS